MSKRVHPEIPVNNADYNTGHGFKKGNPGKPKGATCEFTTLKNAFINAFRKIGGEDAMVRWMTNEAILEKIKRTKKGKIIIKIDLSGERKESFFRMLTTMLPKEGPEIDPTEKELLSEEIELVPGNGKNIRSRLPKYLEN